MVKLIRLIIKRGRAFGPVNHQQFARLTRPAIFSPITGINGKLFGGNVAYKPFYTKKSK